MKQPIKIQLIPNHGMRITNFCSFIFPKLFFHPIGMLFTFDYYTKKNTNIVKMGENLEKQTTD